MSFNVANRVGSHSGHRVGHCDRVGLALNARSAEAGFLAAVVVDAEAFNNCVDSIAVSSRVFKSLDHDNACTVTEQRSSTIGVEWTTMSIGREDASCLMKVATVLWERNRSRTRKRDVAMTRIE